MCHWESLSTRTSQIALALLNLVFLIETVGFISADSVILGAVFGFIFIIGNITLFFPKHFRSISLVYIISICCTIFLDCLLLAYMFSEPQTFREDSDMVFKRHLHELKQSLASGNDLAKVCEAYKSSASAYKCCDFNSDMLREACCPLSDIELPSCSYSYFAISFWIMIGIETLGACVKVFIVTIVAIIRSKNKRYMIKTYQELEEIKLKSGFNAL